MKFTVLSDIAELALHAQTKPNLKTALDGIDPQDQSLYAKHVMDWLRAWSLPNRRDPKRPKPQELTDFISRTALSEFLQIVDRRLEFKVGLSADDKAEIITLAATQYQPRIHITYLINSRGRL